MTKDDVRELFPHIKKGKIYFNHAAIGPLSKTVTDVITGYAIERSDGKIKNYDDYLTIESETKIMLAEILGCESRNLAWTDNVSNAMNMLAQGLNLKKDDEIIVTDIEFPSNVYPFLNLQKNGVKVKFARSDHGKISPESILSLVTDSTRLISVSYVQFTSGWRSDIKKLGDFCRERGIVFSVDGIQGAGALYPDLNNCNVDFFAGGTQKWIMALQGLSYFYISDKLINKLDQKYVGWLSFESAWELLNYDTKLKGNASRFQNGTQNAIATYALHASLKTFTGYGIENVEKNVLENTKYFIRELLKKGIKPLLAETPVENLSGIVTFPFPEPELNLQKLAEKNIHGELRNGVFRFAPHFYNTREEIDTVVEALEKLIR